MAFWRFTGGSPVAYPTLSITANPGDVYDFGTVPVPLDGNWTSDAGPANAFPPEDVVYPGSSTNTTRIQRPSFPLGDLGVATYVGTTATTATAGSGGSLPATVQGYLVINIGGTNFKVPYYTN